MMLRRALLPLTLAATGTALLTACGGGSGGGNGGATSADGTDRLEVVASFYPMRYLAEQIGGERVTVTDLTAPGAEPHELELTAKQVGTVQRADAVLYLKGLQPTVDKAVARSRSAHVVDATAFSPLTSPDGEPGGDHDEHGHDHVTDPHLWLDPTRYAAVAQGVGAELAKADPAGAAGYQQRTDDLTARLGALDQEYREGLRDCADRSFVTSHAAFGHLADRYHLRQIAISGIDPAAEPTPAELARIQRTATAEGATTVFFEPQAGPRLAASVAKDLNLRTSVLDPLESVKGGSVKGGSVRGGGTEDGRTEDGGTGQSGADGADDYFSVMRQNLDHLRAALGRAS
ncbi:metal ABC transporter substrate-binding protein [Kitasatospora sp. NBC_01287]|uniref:metal ABC transporter substrate-binding protein n=1 Tax=Kitasatospora sp. NBC_01287 TaxID=2903573 RepID=UPI00225B07D8|nr:metal ABC transporter substrate-binding protein [Kitasatospora sp. NBC_01287]MCX4749083.1 metal ABC transporter substrate-binding protein [Kitasatospora sp. NBC_01287]